MICRLIERAVRTYIFECAAEEGKAANADVSEADLTVSVREAVQWARGADADHPGEPLQSRGLRCATRRTAPNRCLEVRAGGRTSRLGMIRPLKIL